MKGISSAGLLPSSSTTATTTNAKNRGAFKIKSSNNNNNNNSPKAVVASINKPILPSRTMKLSSKIRQQHNQRTNNMIKIICICFIILVFSMIGQQQQYTTTTITTLSSLQHNNNVQKQSSEQRKQQIIQKQLLINKKLKLINDKEYKRVWTQPNLDEDYGGNLLKENDLLYEGIYKFTETPACSNNNNNNNIDCIIRFPKDIINNNDDNDEIDNSNVCIDYDVCLVTLRGAKGPNVPNQDRSVFISNYNNTSSNSWFLSGIFDGHGTYGHIASQIAVIDLPSRILNMASTKPIKDILYETYIQCDQSTAMSNARVAGTTAVTVLQEGTNIHIASVGDSTAILVQWFGEDGVNNNGYYYRGNGGGYIDFIWRQVKSFLRPTGNNKDDTSTIKTKYYEIIQTSIKHKPSDRKERNRIEANGGIVLIPTNKDETSRVIYEQTMENGQVLQMGLAMSRSLGDKDAKEQNLIIAEPDIISINLRDYYSNRHNNKRRRGSSSDNNRNRQHYSSNNNKQFFVILASDGITDMISNDELIMTLGKVLFPTENFFEDAEYENNNNNNNILYQTCQDIVKKAASKWAQVTSAGYGYRDDISLLVKRIDLR